MCICWYTNKHYLIKMHGMNITKSLIIYWPEDGHQCCHNWSCVLTIKRNLISVECSKGYHTPKTIIPYQILIPPFHNFIYNSKSNNSLSFLHRHHITWYIHGTPPSDKTYYLCLQTVTFSYFIHTDWIQNTKLDAYYPHLTLINVKTAPMNT
jgi:hypothetical protein